ncbi:MAG: DPP IV N-terminal domain-containing protein [Phycisphaerales bacterium]
MPSKRIRASLALGLCLVGAHADAHQPSEPPEPVARAHTEAPVDLLTVAESSEFTRTATHEQVMTLCHRLADASERVTLSTMGATGEGRDIPLLIVADPPISTPEEAAKSHKLVVFLFGNIHAGEVCGKEALLMLVRELALADDAPLLKDLVLLVAPIYNADGNERLGPDNRPGQLGPEEMGHRENAGGLDLNRDYVKLDAPETRALVKLLNTWDPSVIVDTHTTDGSHHRYLVTYQGPKHPAGDHDVITFTRDTLLPAIDARFEDATGEHAFFYGNFEEKHSKWTTYPAEPRYGVAYRGLRNRISIITEAYAYASYEDRVRGTLAFCEATLDEAIARKDEIKKLVKDADERTIKAGREPTDDDQIALRVEARAFPDKVSVLGFDEYDDEGNRTEWAGDETPKDYDVQLINDFVPTLSVRRAFAYVYPASLTNITENLQHHGIEVQELREDAEFDAEVYRIDAFEHADKPFEGHTMVTDVVAAAVPRTARGVPGMMVVRTDQKLGDLASYLLEPQASDGLTAWNFFDAQLSAGADFPVWRVPDPTPLLTVPLHPLAEDREFDKPITPDALWGKNGEHRVDLDGSPAWVSTWLDDEHYLQRIDGRLYKVHAPTGKAEPADTDPDAVAANLDDYPTIDADDAKGIARRWFSDPDPQHDRIVFTHAGDLYVASTDGSGVRRLTATPENEEIPDLSPDGQFVAYVRENNLWVVDLDTGTERALTTGGADDHRFAKASWVYYEEIFGRNWRAFWWSPDSTKIAFFETDSSAVPSFTIIDDEDEPQRLDTVHYPKPGDRNPNVRVHIVDRAGGAPRAVDLSKYDEGAYLVSHVQWTPDSKRLRLDIQDRAQTWLDLLMAPARGGASKVLFRETTQAWVESQHDATFLADASFVLASERDGWRHLYHFDANGKLIAQITSGEYEARDLLHIDEDNDWVYFMGTKDSPLAENLYRVHLDGSALERLTREPGSHAVSLSPSAKYFVDRWSSFETPTKVALRNTQGALVRWIDTNPVRDLDTYLLGDYTLVHIDSEKGVTLHGAMLTPPDFDPAKKYPVWFMTYAGPHAPTVFDSWGSGHAYDRMLSQLGMVVFRADPYPASGQGAVSAWSCYKNLGQREMQDIAELVAWLNTHDFIDPDRIGMSGTSYGGFMTAYALTHSKLFASGIAGASVTDFRDYDSIYTERFMDTPQNNPAGYDGTNVSNAAKDLHGRLMLIHGMMDDNVHMQNAIRLIAALQDAGKDFDLMIYPGSRHGGFGDHYRDLQLNFIRRTLLDTPDDTPPQQRKPEPSESEVIEDAVAP